MERPTASRGLGIFDLFCVVAIIATMVLSFFLITQAVQNFKGKAPKSPSVESPKKAVANPAISALTQRALNGNSIEARKQAAKELSELNGTEACQAMREVVEKSNDVDVKIACIQGLRNNQDLDSVPLLLNIVEGDDNDEALRFQAYVALSTWPGSVDRFPGKVDYKEFAKDYRRDWEYLTKRRKEMSDKKGK